MSEQCDQTAQQTSQQVAEHPAVKELLEQLEVQFGTKFFIVGAGTPEQEAEYKELLAKQEVERREAEAKYARDNPVSPEIITSILLCLAGNSRTRD